MSDNNKLKYSNSGTEKDPITRSEYNARKKMCPACFQPEAAKRNKFYREDLGNFAASTGLGALWGPPGIAVGGAIGGLFYLITPVRYTCIYCGASFCVSKWL